MSSRNPRIQVESPRDVRIALLERCVAVQNGEPWIWLSVHGSHAEGQGDEEARRGSCPLGFLGAVEWDSRLGIVTWDFSF